MTIAEIEGMAKKVTPSQARQGCVILEPPVELIHKPTGRKVWVRLLNKEGLWSGVRVSELPAPPFWHLAENFEPPKDAE